MEEGGQKDRFRPKRKPEAFTKSQRKRSKNKIPGKVAYVLVAWSICLLQIVSSQCTFFSIFYEKQQGKLQFFCIGL